MLFFGQKLGTSESKKLGLHLNMGTAFWQTPSSLRPQWLRVGIASRSGKSSELRFLMVFWVPSVSAFPQWISQGFHKVSPWFWWFSLVKMFRHCMILGECARWCSSKTKSWQRCHTCLRRAPKPMLCDCGVQQRSRRISRISKWHWDKIQVSDCPKIYLADSASYSIEISTDYLFQNGAVFDQKLGSPFLGPFVPYLSGLHPLFCGRSVNVFVPMNQLRLSWVTVNPHVSTGFNLPFLVLKNRCPHLGSKNGLPPNLMIYQRYFCRNCHRHGPLQVWHLRKGTDGKEVLLGDKRLGDGMGWSKTGNMINILING